MSLSSESQHCDENSGAGRSFRFMRRFEQQRGISYDKSRLSRTAQRADSPRMGGSFCRAPAHWRRLTIVSRLIAELRRHKSARNRTMRDHLRPPGPHNATMAHLWPIHAANCAKLRD
jgi:hypothetical protein